MPFLLVWDQAIECLLCKKDCMLTVYRIKQQIIINCYHNTTANSFNIMFHCAHTCYDTMLLLLFSENCTGDKEGCVVAFTMIERTSWGEVT